MGLHTPNLFSGPAGRLLAQIVENSGTEKVVINCLGISSLADQAIDLVASAWKTAVVSSLIFTDVIEGLQEEIEKSLGAPIQKKDAEDLASCSLGYSKNDITSKDFEEAVIISSQMETSHIKSIVSKAFEPNDTNIMLRLPSTPLLANGAFNARRIISEPEDFIWLSLRMADSVESIISTKKLQKPSVIASSLRGAPLATAVGTLVSSVGSIELIDHIGPKNHILEHYAFDVNFSDSHPIYIGDFVIGGTEIKSAHTYCKCMGNQLEGAVVIGSLFDGFEYGTTFPINSLVKLSECRSDIKYEIALGGI